MGRNRRKKNLPQEPVRVEVESLSHDGRGIAHVDGKVVFIDFALPDEQVEFIYTDNRRDYAEGRLHQVILPSAQRIDPQCQHFGYCGACSFQHVDSDQQIAFKESLLTEQLSRVGKVAPSEIWEALHGPAWGYRQKARLSVKHVKKKGRVLVGFREQKSSLVADLQQCHVLHPKVGKKIPELESLISQLSISEYIPQIEVAIGDNGCVLIFRMLQPASEDDHALLETFGKQHDVKIYLQPKGLDSIAPLNEANQIDLHYRLPAFDLTMVFKPTMFIQINQVMNQDMINRVMSTFALKPQDKVLDLFCGLGNFTLPMAREAGQVVGIEGSQELVGQAKQNAELNGIENVDFHVADLTQDVSQFSWAKQSYNKILLDPARSGAADIVTQFAKWQPELIVYVSCNPSTLARDADILVNQMGYKLLKAGVMDMFPQTAHVESIALFEK